jgi:tRNA threonylcarbamoyl adenosine modification protein YeaZ
MRILVIDSALARCTVAVVQDEAVRAQRRTDGAQGQTNLLAGLVVAVLVEAGLLATQFDIIAASVGPGSFTGVRAGLALAHGVGVAGDIPVVGVTVGEALSAALPNLGARALWVAINSRRGRVYLQRDGLFASFALDDLPLPSPGMAVAVAGDAATPVAAFLAARQVALVAARRFAGALPPIEALPLYVDPPLAKPPAGGLRPPPV